MVQIIKTVSGTFTVPADWNSANNKIEVNGGGAGGIISTAFKASGGGGYSKIVNLSLSPGASIAFTIGAGGGVGVNGGDSWFNGASLAASSVGAKGGAAGTSSTSGLGGQASAGVGTTKYSGGDGAATGGGGGGAAGPNGAGGAGSGLTGGTGDNGSGGTGGSSTLSGGNGTEWGSAGSGGGGGGATSSSFFPVNGGAGGYYGGAGGSCQGPTIGTPGTGAPGVIVITYTPSTSTTYTPGHDAIALSGKVPTLVNSAIPTTMYTPGHGAIALAGKLPTLLNAQNAFAPAHGSISLAGLAPQLTGESGYAPDAGAIVLTGYPPKIVFLPFFDDSVTVISQYANSPAIMQMVANFQNWIAPGQSLNAFYDLIWNIDTAQGYGLDVWGRIVGVGRVLQVVASGQYFGFAEAVGGDHIEGWNVATFYDGSSVTSNYILADDAYRQLILAKAAANICNGSVPAINQVLIDIFGASGNAYVVDNENMTMTYYFTFPLDPVQQSIVYNSGVLPKPAGVLATVHSP